MSPLNTRKKQNASPPGRKFAIRICLNIMNSECWKASGSSGSAVVIARCKGCHVKAWNTWNYIIVNWDNWKYWWHTFRFVYRRFGVHFLPSRLADVPTAIGPANPLYWLPKNWWISFARKIPHVFDGKQRNGRTATRILWSYARNISILDNKSSLYCDYYDLETEGVHLDDGRYSLMKFKLGNHEIE